MIKEALQYLINLGSAEVLELGDQKYSTHQQIHRIKEPTVDAIIVRSLSGLVDYIKSHFDGDDSLLIHVDSPTKVEAFTKTNRDAERNHYIRAEALLPSIRFNNFYDAEEFNIKLQSAFVKNDDRNIMLKVVGNIKEEAVQSIGDDGISQSVKAKAGVAVVADVKVPNPVLLKPFRTFVEVDQPETNFVFRMRTGPACALFEADGGAWELKAMNNIKAYLQDQLKEEIESKRVFIIA